MQTIEDTKTKILSSGLPRFLVVSPRGLHVWLIVALSIFAWGPLLTPAYFFNAHDAKHSVFFLVEFDQTFRDGYWWPRWSPDFAFGYGYPLFNLYAPLAFYVAEIVHLSGLGFTATIKTMYILATIGAGLGMYGFAKRLFGPQAGLLAGVVYMYAPFHLVDIFVRSAYAEFVALAIIPFLFLAFTNLVAVPTLRRIALAAFTYGLLTLTHLATFFTFSPFLMVYVFTLLVAKTRSNLKSLLLNMIYVSGAGMLGVILAAIYLIPLITETRFVKVEQWTSGSYNYLQHFVYFFQFLSPTWGYGYSGAGLQDDISFQLGIVVVALVSFALVRLITHPFPGRGVAFSFFLSTLVIIFLMSPLAEPVWQAIPIATLVQFPWRLLGMTAFTMSVVAGSLLAGTNCQLSTVNFKSSISSQTSIPNGHDASNPPSTIYYPPSSTLRVYLLCLVVILASFPYTLPQYTEIPDWAETPLAVVNWDRGSIVDRVGMVAFTQEQPQTSPLEQQYLNGEPLSAAAIISGQGSVETLHRGGASSQVRVVAAEPVTLQFYTYDYPGWQVTRDGQHMPHRHEPPFGLITVDVPAGEHIVLLQMGSTLSRTLGGIISSLTLLIIAGLYFWNDRPFRPKQNVEEQKSLGLQPTTDN
ncbi:MAG: hypothetical protein HYR94_00340 [Chloroflexi bacterium]|nr:hypothetical protein [Chloroflexota bacterium]